MSVKVMAWVWNHSQAKGSTRFVLLAIADAADHDGSNAWPSVSTLCRKTGLSESTLHRCISELTQMGELTVQRQRGGPRGLAATARPNKYAVIMTDAATVTHPGEVAAPRPARRTSYAGTVMRSRLEADYAASLDNAGRSWRYEPLVLAGPVGQWLPDFCVEGEQPSYVEIKPVQWWQSSSDATKTALLSRMGQLWLSYPSATAELVIWEFGVGHRVTISGSKSSCWWIRDGDGPRVPWQPGDGS